jgi:hypothetical protein
LQAAAGGVACLALGIALARLHPFTPTQVVVALIIALVLAIRGPRLKPFFGAFERVFYLSSLPWLFVVAIDLVRISG